MKRDCLVVDTGKEELLVACDALGGIGPKPGDSLPVPLEVSAQFTARVALAEILAAGGEPLALSVTLSMEPYPWIEEVQRGIARELRTIGRENLPCVFSTEKNIPTLATGLGVTVLGRRTQRKEEPLLEGTLYALGVPSCGREVLENLHAIADLADILRLREECPEAEIVPVGSRGIFCEALLFLWGRSATLSLNPHPPFSLYKSCGPATVLLFASTKNRDELASCFQKPLWVVGELRAQGQPMPELAPS
jgi:hypothetical protein